MPVWPCGAVEEGPAGFVPSGGSWGSVLSCAVHPC